ncbi:hypothetical protein ACWEO2_26830 [Nocardia sp. NPDC004278]
MSLRGSGPEGHLAAEIAGSNRKNAAFVNEAVAACGSAMLSAEADRPAAESIDAMFTPGAYGSRQDLVVCIELVALAARDARARERLRELWTQWWLPDRQRQLSAEYSTAWPERVAQVAQGPACLFEARWAFQLRDINEPEREQQVGSAATALLATPEPPPPGPENGRYVQRAVNSDLIPDAHFV